jgi:hypothetical protein
VLVVLVVDVVVDVVLVVVVLVVVVTGAPPVYPNSAKRSPLPPINEGGG